MIESTVRKEPDMLSLRINYVDSQKGWCPSTILSFIVKQAKSFENCYEIHVSSTNYIIPELIAKTGCSLTSVLSALDEDGKSQAFMFSLCAAYSFFHPARTAPARKRPGARLVTLLFVQIPLSGFPP